MLYCSSETVRVDQHIFVIAEVVAGGLVLIIMLYLCKSCSFEAFKLGNTGLVAGEVAGGLVLILILHLCYVAALKQSGSSNTGVIAGAVAGGLVLIFVLVAVLVGCFVIRQR